MTFSAELTAQAEQVLAAARTHHLLLCTAESCTGGLIAGLLTEIPGSSDVVDRGFVTYSNEAKTEMLGVSPETLAAHGAVSQETAIAMAEGAVHHARADISVAVTGIAGPGGGTTEKPVGLVHIAAFRSGYAPWHEACHFGDPGRDIVRLRTVATALAFLMRAITV